MINRSDENTSKLFPEREPDDLSGHAHRQLIGLIGLVLPALLWLLDGLRPTTGLHRWQPLTSVSAYYYTQAVSVLAGALTALAIFLFLYGGYDNKYQRHDRWAAIIAGIAAILVALFPTKAPLDSLRFSWWTDLTGSIHYLAAVILFASFIFFCLIQFPKSNLEKEKLPADKRRRNAFYIFCGLAIVACMVWVLISLDRDRSAPIFWPEALALEFFALSWLVKGRIDKTIAAAGRQLLHYGQHPQQIVNDVRSAMRG